MALINITSANSTLRLVCPAMYPSGFDFDDFAADRMFETAALQIKEDMMSADGKYHAGIVFNPVEFTVSLSPTSQAGDKLDTIFNAEQAAMSAFSLNITLTVPALDATWNFVNGVLYSWNPNPSGARVLQPRQAVFHFERVTRS